VLPIVHGLEREFGDRIIFVRVNILHPENEPLMEQFSFSATPEFYLVDETGRIIGFWDDSVTENDLRQAFDIALNP
jgi:zona occludens toxin (predicted ATPase)